MRILLILALLALVVPLAGCTQLDPGKGGKFTPTCPTWVKGLSSQTQSKGFKFLYDNKTTQPTFDSWDFSAPTYDASGNPQKRGTGFGDGLLSFQGHPLDMLVFDFAASSNLSETKKILLINDAEVHLTFFASADGYVGAPLEAWDWAKGRESPQHEWIYKSKAHGAPTFFNVTLEVDLSDSQSAPMPQGVFVYWSWIFDIDHNRDTPSFVYTGYSPDMWYRTCNRDGSPA